MKKQLLLLFSILFAGGLFAQEVSKRIVVEHFTNTRCSICSNRNPGFYQNLDNHPDAIHLAIHPSRPYPSCVLNQHNTSENDARTNYYGIYGSTPRLVVQGNVIATGDNYGSPSIFSDVANETTPISIELYQVKENNELQVDVVIRAEADNSIDTAYLFLAAVEQVVNYAAPNGESEHRDVFRRTFTDAPTGLAIGVPATAGESIASRYTLAANAEWVFDEMFVLAILNDVTDRSVIQAAATNPEDNEPFTSTQNLPPLPLQLFPNPVIDQLEIQLPQAVNTARIQLSDVSGKIVLQQTIRQHESLQLGHLPSGSYWLEVRTVDKMAVRQIVKK